MRTAVCLFLGMLLFSCNNFELKKLSSDDILQEELKHLDWSQVDVYPTFENCKPSTEAIDNQRCFNDTLGMALYDYFNGKDIAILKLAGDTLFFNFHMSEKGTISLDTIKGMALPQPTYYVLTTYTSEALSQLPQSYPAQKRGVPVATKFSLPVIVIEE